jgi:hypothetical protein
MFPLGRARRLHRRAAPSLARLRDEREQDRRAWLGRLVLALGASHSFWCGSALEPSRAPSALRGAVTCGGCSLDRHRRFIAPGGVRAGPRLPRSTPPLYGRWPCWCLPRSPLAPGDISAVATARAPWPSSRRSERRLPTPAWAKLPVIVVAGEPMASCPRSSSWRRLQRHTCARPRGSSPPAFG